MENNEKNLFDRDRALALDDAALLGECEQDFFKSTGKGGQKRNKSSSAVRLIHLPSGTAVTDCSERSQAANRKAALAKLRLEMALQFRVTPASPPERPECGLTNADYFLTVAHLFDVLCDNAWAPAPSAESMQLSSSKLLKLLARDPRVFGRFNDFRRAAGMSILHP